MKIRFHGIYWSSSSYETVALDAWVVFFNDGDDTHDNKATSYHVRAGRGGS